MMLPLSSQSIKNSLPTIQSYIRGKKTAITMIPITLITIELMINEHINSKFIDSKII
jgi:hypothetical protein